MSMSNELRNIVIIFLVETEIIVTVVTVSLGFFSVNSTIMKIML